MLNQFSRTQLLYGEDNMGRLASSRVAVFGIGGMGGYVVEALARSGIGALDIIDDDRICITNINRQILATGKTVGRYKVEVADIYDTSICPLAKVMRRECRKRGIDSLKVVYSKEEPIRPLEDMSISCRQHCVCPPGTVRKCTVRRDIPGSTAFVPSVVGLIIAGEVINDLTV